MEAGHGIAHGAPGEAVAQGAYARTSLHLQLTVECCFDKDSIVGGDGMRLSWNEIRARTARFAEEWKGAHYERGETFYNEFFEVFGVTEHLFGLYEKLVVPG